MLARALPLRLDVVAAVLLAAGVGALAGRMPTVALGVLGILGAVAAMLALQDRALPFFVIAAAVIPYFPPEKGFEGDPIVPSVLIPVLFFGCVLGPFIWSAATRRVSRPIRRTEVLVGAATAAVVILSLASRQTAAIGTLSTGAFLAAIVGYLCAKRFTTLEDWGLPSLLGLLVLIGLGLSEYEAGSEARIGYLVGYPILYAILLIALLPPALAWLHPRSKLLTVVVPVFAVMALILSQTRSGWLGLIVEVAVLAALLFRWGRPRLIVALVVTGVVASLAVVANSDLSKLVESRLSEETLASQSFTHREFSYGYTFERFLEEPIAGRGWAGALKDDIAARTGLSAADNGYLSLAGDLGILGLAFSLVPVAVMLGALVRLWRTRRPEPAAVALTLSLVGALVATIFFDTFYWPQGAVLIFTMAGALSAHMARS